MLEIDIFTNLSKHYFLSRIQQLAKLSTECEKKINANKVQKNLPSFCEKQCDDMLQKQLINKDRDMISKKECNNTRRAFNSLDCNEKQKHKPFLERGFMLRLQNKNREFQQRSPQGIKRDNRITAMSIQEKYRICLLLNRARGKKRQIKN